MRGTCSNLVTALQDSVKVIMPTLQGFFRGGGIRQDFVPPLDHFKKFFINMYAHPSPTKISISPHPPLASFQKTLLVPQPHIAMISDLLSVVLSAVEQLWLKAAVNCPSTPLHFAVHVRMPEGAQVSWFGSPSPSPAREYVSA